MKLFLEDNCVNSKYIEIKAKQSHLDIDEYVFNVKIIGDIDSENLYKIKKQLELIEKNFDDLFELF
jgi:hypothetical protein